MKSKLILGLLSLFMVFSMTSCGYERVDAGCEGIKVNLYGSDKGLKQQWIDKWDGKLPVYGSLPTLFKGIE
jgi:hypothetical protein